MKRLKILGVHGVGDHRNSTWKEDWEETLRAVFPGQRSLELEFAFLAYDDIFDSVELSLWETANAAYKLARSGASNAFRAKRGFFGEVADAIQWTAGYVVAWLEDEGFQRETRARVLDTVAREKPDLIVAHSLGSLVTYDAFVHDDARRPAVAGPLARVHYVTLGSQLGNSFVVGNLASGRIEPLPVSHWSHLYNEEDDIFTAPIKLWDATNFVQVETPFDIGDFGDHSPVEYLKHRNAIENVWRPSAERRIASRGFGTMRPRPQSPTVLRRLGRNPRRALLVGINDYPSEKDRLEGCVNDVFLMSSVLQECGFPPESIRVCLNDRATAKGITERLKWLLDDPRPGDDRVFFYSGHGANIPEYGEKMEPDRRTETLVPWDFDWSPERAIVDDQIFSLYSQLPFDTRFALILDCCHSGGMHRQGGAKVRGLNPPDDIRHRDLEWNKDADMWVERGFKGLNRRFSPKKELNEAFFGMSGASTRIGRASLVRVPTDREYQRLKRRSRDKRVGPYLPLIIEACREAELSYEYRHGVTSYGAFTYSLALELRKQKRITYERLVKVTADRLKDLGYEQRPQILGPRAIVGSRVPWRE